MKKIAQNSRATAIRYINTRMMRAFDREIDSIELQFCMPASSRTHGTNTQQESTLSTATQFFRIAQTAQKARMAARNCRRILRKKFGKF
jgi:hypothetical protein